MDEKLDDGKIKAKNKKGGRIIILFIAIVFVLFGAIIITYFCIRTEIEKYNENARNVNLLYEQYADFVREAGCSEEAISKNIVVYNEINTNLISVIKNIDEIIVLNKTNALIKNEIDGFNAKYELVNQFTAKAFLYNETVDAYNEIVQKYYDMLSIDSSDLNNNQNFYLSNIEINDDVYFDFEYMSQQLGVIENDINAVAEKKKELEDNYSIGKKYWESVDAYNEKIKKYNAVAIEYNKLLEISFLECITDIPDGPIELKNEITLDKDKYVGRVFQEGEIDLIDSDASKVEKELDEVIEYYILAKQVTNPSESFIIEKLTGISDITSMQAVNDNNDPSGLLGKEGSFTSCIYFTVKDNDVKSVKGSSALEKGTAGGGAIEVYENSEDAIARCEYLAQFDNTLLDSGSYSIVGTILIRTSYKLSDKRQNEITKKIIDEVLLID